MTGRHFTRREFAKAAGLGVSGAMSSLQETPGAAPLNGGYAPVQAFDFERARRETPGTERVVHFNHAGASLMPRPVLDAVQNHLRLEAEIGGYDGR